MGTALLHLGGDLCSRIAVLNRAGYKVVEPGSGSDDHELREGIAAILVNEDGIAAESVTPEAVDPDHVLPRILFKSLYAVVSPETYDLVVPNLSSPSDWLPKIQELITKSLEIRAQAQAIQQESATLRESSRRLREESQLVREESKTINESR